MKLKNNALKLMLAVFCVAQAPIMLPMEKQFKDDDTDKKIDEKIRNEKLRNMEIVEEEVKNKNNLIFLIEKKGLLGEKSKFV